MSNHQINDGESEDSNIVLKVNRFEVEENAVFIDFSQKEILSNIENFKSLNFYHRISLSKNIAAVNEVCGGHTLFNNFLLELAADCEQIKQQLIDYLRLNLPKANSLTDFQHLYIEPLIKLINCSHLQIREESCVLLTQITHKLTGKERTQVIRLALQLQKSEDEESKIISIHLIAKMTPDMPTQQAQLFFKTDYTQMYKHSSVRIKRQIIHNAHIIAKNVTKEFLNRQIIDNFFLEKCKEPIWGIRKACIQIMPQLVVLTDTKKQLLAHSLLTLTKDGSKMVKVAAYKAIPQFLANYNSQHAPDKLVNLYIHLMDSQVNQLLSKDVEIAIKVAFYFPGVMLTLGPNKWPIMKKLFMRLLFHKSDEVRMPIASSLHQVSRILGPELSKQHMFKALDIILRDSSDSLKLSTISHISEFVQLFEQTTRQNLIDIFLQLQKDPKKWRIRYQIAHQLNILSKIYQTETVFKYIYPISLKLCNDNVYEVRFQAAKQMYHVIDNMKQLPYFQEMALESLKGYALSEKYVQRQTFSWMVRNLYKVKQFKQTLFDLILQIAKDKVTIVRIALSISLSEIIKTDPQQKQIFKDVISIIMQDQEDVKQYLI